MWSSKLRARLATDDDEQLTAAPTAMAGEFGIPMLWHPPSQDNPDDPNESIIHLLFSDDECDSFNHIPTGEHVAPQTNSGTSTTMSGLAVAAAAVTAAATTSSASTTTTIATNRTATDKGTRVYWWNNFKRGVVIVNGEALSLETVMTFGGRVHNAAVVHAVEACEQLYRRPDAGGYVHDKITAQELSNLFSGLMNESIGKATKHHGEVALVVVSEQDRALFDALPWSTLMNAQCPSLAATCYLQLTRALNPAFVKLVNLRLHNEFKGGLARFDVGALKILVSAALDRAPAVDDKDLAIYRVLRAAIENNWPKTITDALGSASATTFQLRSRRIVGPASQAHVADLERLNTAASKRLDAMSDKVFDSDQVAKLGALNAWIGTHALKHNLTLVGSTPLGLFGQQRSGCAAPVVGDLDIGVCVPAGESDEQRSERRRELIAPFESLLQDLAKDNDAPKFNVVVEPTEICVHIKLVSVEATKQQICKFDLCDGKPGAAGTAPLAPALNVALRYDNDNKQLHLSLHRAEADAAVRNDDHDSLVTVLRAGVVDLRRAAVTAKTPPEVDKKLAYLIDKYSARYEVHVDGKPRDPFLPAVAVAVVNRQMCFVGVDASNSSLGTSLRGYDLIKVGELLAKAKADVVTASCVEQFEIGTREKEDAEKQEAAAASKERSRSLRKRPPPDVSVDGHHRKQTRSSVAVAGSTTTLSATAAASAVVVELEVGQQEVDADYDEDWVCGDDVERTNDASKWSITQRLMFAVWYSAPHDRGLRSWFLPDATLAIRALRFMQDELGTAAKNNRDDRLDILGRKSGTDEPLACTTRLFPCFGGKYGKYVRGGRTGDPVNPLGEVRPCYWTSSVLQKFIDTKQRKFGIRVSDEKVELLSDWKHVLKKAMKAANRRAPLYGMHSLMVTEDALHVTVDVSQERRQRHGAATQNAKKRVGQLDNEIAEVHKLVADRCGVAVANSLYEVGNIDKPLASSEEGMTRNGTILNKWEQLHRQLLLLLDHDKTAALVEKWVQRHVDRSKRLAVDAQASSKPLPPTDGEVVSAPAQMAVDESVGECTIAHAKPANASQVFRVVAHAQDVQSALHCMLGANPPKCAVRVERRYDADSQVPLDDACREMFNFRGRGDDDPITHDAAVARVAIERCRLIREKVLIDPDLNANTSLIITDPNKGGCYSLINDEGDQFVTFEFNTAIRAQYEAAGVRRQQFDQLATNILSRKAACKKHRIMVIGGNYTDGMHEFVWQLLQDGVQVLIMEETGTSRNCALCTGELSGAPAIKYKYMCDEALNHMYAVADNKDAVVADNKGAVAHNKGAAAPSLKSVFVPIDMSIDRPIPIGPMEVRERPKIDERLYQRVDMQPVERQKRGGVTETELKAAVMVSAMRAEAKVVEEERAKVVEEERAKVERAPRSSRRSAPRSSARRAPRSRCQRSSSASVAIARRWRSCRGRSSCSRATSSRNANAAVGCSRCSLSATARWRRTRRCALRPRSSTSCCCEQCASPSTCCATPRSSAATSGASGTMLIGSRRSAGRSTAIRR
jgi:hypothetical protein